jgi:hypothetical protein
MVACSAVEFKGAKATVVAAKYREKVFVLSESQRATPLNGALKSWSRRKRPFYSFVNPC